MFNFFIKMFRFLWNSNIFLIEKTKQKKTFVDYDVEKKRQVLKKKKYLIRQSQINLKKLIDFIFK